MASAWLPRGPGRNDTLLFAALTWEHTLMLVLPSSLFLSLFSLIPFPSGDSQMNHLCPSPYFSLRFRNLGGTILFSSLPAFEFTVNYKRHTSMHHLSRIMLFSSMKSFLKEKALVSVRGRRLLAFVGKEKVIIRVRWDQE